MRDFRQRRRHGLPPMPPARPAVPIVGGGLVSPGGSSIAPGGSRMCESVLSNGVRILTETIPSVRSVSAGVWVKQGSAHEHPGIMGASHLLEHMVFKGTERRSPRELALALEALGGSLDAYTSREHTSFQARVLDEHLLEAMDVLSDMVLHPLLRDEDLELEREVVLEEISTVDDTPDDLVFELHAEAFWNGHPYGHSILGTRETVAGMQGETLRELHRSKYRSENLIVAAAGNVEHERMVELGERFFGGLTSGGTPSSAPLPRPVESGLTSVVRDAAQTHIVFGASTPARTDMRRYPLILLSAALGGGMSSRLFQRVREELALAYTVYTFQSFYSQGGISGVYVGTRPGWGEKAVEAIREELGRVAREGLPGEELARTKSQVKGQIMLSLESTGARLYRLAGFALHDEQFLTLDELLSRVDAVTEEEVLAAAAASFDPHRQFVLQLGPGGEPQESVDS